MGSYNVACSISKISIGYGTNIVYIPLEVNRFSYEIGDGNNSLIHPWCFYSPVTLPIFGQYDDYGGIENIIRDENVEYIENFFKCKIEKISDVERQPSPIKSGMFIHREIYDAMINFKFDQWGKKKKEEFNFFTTAENVFDKFVYELKKIQKDIEETNKYYKSEGLEEYKKFIRVFDSDDLYVVTLSNIFNFRNHDTIRKIYIPLISQGLLRKAIIDFAIFECVMSANNSFYFPAMNGYQCGHDFASRDLYKKSLHIINRRIRKYKMNGYADFFLRLKWKYKNIFRNIMKKIKG